MKSIFALIALLLICLSISSVSAQVGNEKLHLLVEYFLPYWRQHRARLRPYTFAQPVPVWRVARSADETEQQQPQPLNKQNDEYVGCIAYNKRMLCERISNHHRTTDRVECDVEKRFINPALDNFISFSISDKRADNETFSQKYNLFPKRPLSMKIEEDSLKSTRQLSLSTSDNVNDEGFKFADKKCWKKLNELFSRVRPTLVRVTKVNEQKQQAKEEFHEAIIGNLIQIDFGFNEQ